MTWNLLRVRKKIMEFKILYKDKKHLILNYVYPTGKHNPCWHTRHWRIRGSHAQTQGIPSQRSVLYLCNKCIKCWWNAKGQGKNYIYASFYFHFSVSKYNWKHFFDFDTQIFLFEHFLFLLNINSSSAIIVKLHLTKSNF